MVNFFQDVTGHEKSPLSRRKEGSNARGTIQPHIALAVANLFNFLHPLSQEVHEFSLQFRINLVINFSFVSEFCMVCK